MLPVIATDASNLSRRGKTAEPFPCGDCTVGKASREEWSGVLWGNVGESGAGWPVYLRIFMPPPLKRVIVVTLVGRTQTLYVGFTGIICRIIKK